MRETRHALEQLLETMDVMKDKKLMREIALCRREARAGKTRPSCTLLKEQGVEFSVRALGHVSGCTMNFRGPRALGLFLSCNVCVRL
jgi:hypothetical protein